MIGIEVRDNIRDVVAELGALPGRLKDRATVRAINRAVDAVATVSNREIRKVYNLKARAVAAAMSKSRASTAQVSPRGVVTMSGKRIGLIEFDARQTRRMAGTSVRIKLAGGRKTIRHAFIATNSHTGYKGVFVREGKDRYPIRNLRSISLPRAFRNQAVIDACRAIASETFTKNFAQQIRYLGNR